VVVFVLVLVKENKEKPKDLSENLAEAVSKAFTLRFDKTRRSSIKRFLQTDTEGYCRMLITVA
jgi:hypothetical protein